MIPLTCFPPLNASLNALNAVLLLLGLYFIKKGKVGAHRATMICALITSAIFLTCYLYYHFHHGITRFSTPGWPKRIYLTILISHTILAIVVVPLILVALWFAMREQFEMHKKITRWAWPIWMYVSVTGVIVYWILYWLYPVAAS